MKVNEVLWSDWLSSFEYQEDLTEELEKFSGDFDQNKRNSFVEG